MRVWVDLSHICNALQLQGQWCPKTTKRHVVCPSFHKEVLALVRLRFEVLLQVGLNLIELFGYILDLVQLRTWKRSF